MRSKLLAVGAVLVAVVFAGLGAGCSSSGDDSASATSPGDTTSTGPTKRTIKLLASVTKARPVDLPPRNVQNKGDRVFVESQLRNAVPQFGRPKGAIVGTDYSTITYLSERKRQVSVQITLPGGGLRLLETIQVGKPGADVEIPVVSGTRDYAGATGVMEVRDGPEGQTLNIYRLRLPASD